MSSPPWNLFNLSHKSPSTRHLKYAICSLITVFLIGTSGYYLLEGWNLLDSLYMTVITLTTVGYGEVREISSEGKIFTIFLIISGVGIVAYLAGVFTRTIIEGEIREIVGRRKLEKKIQKLKDHYIVCGFGRIGKVVCRELTTKPLPFLIIEKNIEKIQKDKTEEYLCLHGDAASEKILLEAGVKRAKGLIVCTSSDADNLYTTLIARELNNKLFILTRSEIEGGERKLLWAGANKVISPHHIGGVRMAQAILRPNVLDFIEIATQSQSMELQIEELLIRKESSFAGATISDCGLKQDFGLMIVAIKKLSGEMIFNPFPENTIEEGDVLIALGERDNFLQFESGLL